MSDRVKAIPLFLSYSDVKKLYDNLNIIVHNHNFCTDSSVILGQVPMALDLYLSIRYDGVNEDSIIHFE